MTAIQYIDRDEAVRQRRLAEADAEIAELEASLKALEAAVKALEREYQNYLANLPNRASKG